MPQSRSYAVCTGVCTIRALAGSAGHARTRTRGCKIPAYKRKPRMVTGFAALPACVGLRPIRDSNSSRELRMPTQEVGGFGVDRGTQRSRPAVRCEPCSIPRAPIRTCAARRERLETESQACRRGRERVVGAGPVPDRDSPPQSHQPLRTRRPSGRRAARHASALRSDAEPSRQLPHEPVRLPAVRTDSGSADRRRAAASAAGARRRPRTGRSP